MKIFIGTFVVLVLFSVTVSIYYNNRLKIFTKSLMQVKANESSPNRLPTLQSVLTTGPSTLRPLRSWFKSFGLDKLDMLKDMEIPRPLFNFTITPWRVVSATPSIVSGKAINWSMIVVIKSHYQRSERRDLIRKTWGSVQYLEGVRLEMVFAVALAENSVDRLQLEKENITHGDLLQISMAEKYQDIGLKAIAGMQWVKEALASKGWIYSSSDDDIFPDLKRLLKTISDLAKQTRESKKRMVDIDDNPILCAFAYRPGPPPKRFGKWKVDVETYPYKTYPTFCLGAFYSMPAKLSNSIFEVSRTMPYFRMDDVWITAFLRLKLCDSIIDGEFIFNRTDRNCGISTIQNAGIQHAPSMTAQRRLARWKSEENQILSSGLDIVKRGTNFTESYK